MGGALSRFSERGGWLRGPLKITHSVQFDVDLELSQPEAILFVRDAERSLSQANFIEELEHFCLEGQAHVRARIPVNAALFGQQTLVFESRLEPIPKGARLTGVPLEAYHPGWAEVTGEAIVRPLPEGSHVSYHFDITIHLSLPEPERWGGQALTKMIQFTAQRVLESISAEFPKAVQAAATELEEAGGRGTRVGDRRNPVS